MYTIIDYNDKRILRVWKQCRKIFVVNGQIVKVPKNGIVVFDKGTEICVCKMLHFVKHNVDMAIARSTMYHNATIEKYSLKVPQIEIDETEKILSSLELVEKI